MCLFVVGLSGCNLIAKVNGGSTAQPGPSPSSSGASGPSGSSSSATGPSGPTSSASPAADENVPREVRYVLNELDSLEGMIQNQQFARYAAVSGTTWKALYEPEEEAVRTYAKLPALKERLRAADLKVAAMAGPNAKRIYGDGMRVKTARAEALEEADKAIGMCQEADARGGVYNAGETHATRLRDRYKKYLEQLARAEKMDPAVVAYRGQLGGSTVDVKMKLVVCEYGLAQSRMQYDDEYLPEYVKTETKKGCGKQTFSAGGVATGGGRFAAFERMPGSTTYAEKINCKAIPKADKIGGHLQTAAKQFKSYESYKQVVFVATGKPYVQENPNDYRLYKYQDIIAYSPEMTFAMNPCNGDAKTVCEVSGSKSVAMYNRMSHHAARAEVHKAAGRTDRCKAQLKAGWAEWQQFKEMFEDGKKSKSWIEGFKYKIRKGDTLPEAEFVKKFEADAKVIDDRVIADWCSKK